MGVLDLNKLEILRRRQNKELILKMRKGEPLKGFDSQSSWFPPRPIIQKDKDAIGRLYAKTSAVPSFSKGASKTSSVSYLLSRKKS
jgi:hypothetical protein